MEKKMVTILILLFLLLTSTTVAAFTKPRVIINEPLMSTVVYCFYDTELDMLCYVTKYGQSINCMPYQNLTFPARAVIDKTIQEKSENGKTPRVIMIP